jgi:hypothetical protein
MLRRVKEWLVCGGAIHASAGCACSKASAACRNERDEHAVVQHGLACQPGGD